MGGFALHDADKSFLRVLDGHTFKELDRTGEIEWPAITSEEIQDRSKADIFSKGIVLMQTTWFIVQCISRFATKLAVTELEVVTFAFALLNGITYWLWWHKPSDVRCAVPVYLKSAEESSNSTVSKARRKRDTHIGPSTKGEGFLASFSGSIRSRYERHGIILTILYILLWVPIEVISGPIWVMIQQKGTVIPDNDTTRVPTFYSPVEKKRLLGFEPSFWTMIGVIALFGAIHFIPWPSAFPTAAEKWLWRVSAISITGGPILTFFPVIMRDWVSNPSLKSILNDSAGVIFSILVPVYLISRLILLILPLVLLRSLPSTTLIELKWSKLSPHI